jgi:hypothetical protein
MLIIKKTIAVLTFSVSFIVALCFLPAGAQDTSNSGPVLGKWEFAGKDNTGLVWSGTLDIQKLDPAKFDAKKYISLCSLEVQSTDSSKGTKGVEAPCKWDPSSRLLTFGDTWPALNVYTAVLSADGKSLTQGKWTERNFVRGNAGPVVRSGEWSAKLTNR